jgi:ATP-binding cassette, subfamily B, bacterial
MNSPEPASATPSLWSLYRALWHYARGMHLRVIASNGLLISSQLVKLAIPWLTAQAINALQLSGTDSIGHAALLILGILIATTVSWAMHGPGRILERSIGVQVRQKLSDELYHRVSTLPLAWHEKHHSGETLFRIGKTTGALSDFAQSQFIFLQNTVNIAGPLVALMFLSTTVGAIALIGYLLVGLVIVRFDRVLIGLVRIQNDAERRYSAALVDTLGNVGTVISLRLQNATRSMLHSRLVAVFEPLRRNIVLNEQKWCAMDLLTTCITWGMVATYAWSAKSSGGVLLLGNVFMVYQYANQAHGVIAAIAMHYQSFARMQADYASADPIRNATECVAPQVAVPQDWKRIDIDGLEFSYSRSRRDTPMLNGAALRLNRGETIALVGPSGSGKSTLMRVLAGLYEPSRGRFAIDGMPHLAMRNLGATTTLIPQDAEVFEGTVLDNITFGVEHASEAVAQALRVSSFDSVVATLPQGLATMLTERGINLSGGQKQRLALARGIVAAQASSLLLLDEPTSSLDALTEAHVFSELRNAVADACVIASVHRLNLLPRFDRVMLMDDGRVVDAGSVAELLERQPLFRDLWQRSLSTPETSARAA